MRGRSEEPAGPGESTLVTEAEAILTGRALGLYQRAGLTVPVWVHLNWLAHGPPEELCDLARREWGPGRPEDTWAWAVSTLAREVHVGSQGDLVTVRQLQGDCLVPMELALMHPGREAVLPRHVLILGLPRVLGHPSVRSPQ